MHIAAYKLLIENTIPSIEKLQNELVKKSDEMKSVVKIGRTHFMDATPFTLGQEFSGYVAQLAHGLKALKNTLDTFIRIGFGWNCSRNRFKYTTRIC